ncbi:FAD-binding oxidoreductase [Corynebacterium sp.]|uniref:FAD-binding oxidoreductase n=1 Tax=Corynebacterium sp. TaxID=1720 RepID=UPI0026DB0613|nr:FAD-binding oxidoreductase [Corynebacterium sp.]MDO5076882.1 FAD-binding oxidoreductase [Corynebacterium sp.]
MSAQLPVPPMTFYRWGTPDEAKPLNPGIRRLLRTVFATDPSEPHDVSPADIKLSPCQVTPADVAEFTAIVGPNFVSTAKEHRLPRARGKSYPDLLDWRSGAPIDAPDAVVAPATEAEVLSILQYCTQEGIAVVPFGGGTSVVGGLTPVRGKHRAVISLDVARFNQLEDVDPVSGLATLGAGMFGPQAEMALAEHNLQLGHFPQSFPYGTIGGYAATRSSGQSSAGYGRFDEMVRALTVVTPTGILEVGGNAPASAAGPDFKDVFLGSEGTLGVITKVRCRVHPIPESKRYEAFRFPNFAAGSAAVRQATQQQTGATVIRLSDEIESSLNLSSGNKIGGSGGAAASGGCLCITLCEGTAEHAASRHAETRAAMLAAGGTSLGDGPARAWEQGRFSAPVVRDALLDADILCETLETATDWNNVANLKLAVSRALATSLTKSGTMAVVMCHISHVYQTGCSLYFTVVANQSQQPHQQWADAKRAACEAIVAHGGTITHHHAVGTDHLAYMQSEISPLGTDLLKALKNTLDPEGILNPGKLIPEAAS